VSFFDFVIAYPKIFVPLKPRWLLLFWWQKSKQKTMSAASASLKIDITTLKGINLFPLHYNFEQNAFLRFVPSIFLTLTSQGGNQGISLWSMCKK